MERTQAGRALAALRVRTTKDCAYCAMPFETYANGKQAGIYCSGRCRQAAWSRENRDRERERLREYRKRRRAAALAQEG